MYIKINLETSPPALSLQEPDDFRAFSVRVSRPRHTFVAPDALGALAGARAADPEWARQLDEMLAYAATKGWVADDGTVRAHIEWDAG